MFDFNLTWPKDDLINDGNNLSESDAPAGEMIQDLQSALYRLTEVAQVVSRRANR